MALIRWMDENDFFSPLERMRREMDRIWSSYRPADGPVSRSGVYPALNVYDDGESFVVWAEVPGVDPKSLDLTVTNDTLSLKGERPVPEIPEGASFHRRERDSGRFRRAMTLPQQVDSSKVQANYENGILKIILPRSEQAKQRKVEIKAV